MGCPGQPDWVTISAAAKEIYLPANEAIERAYLGAHAGHATSVLFGSQFDESRGEVQLPKGAPNRKFGNALLMKFRGRRKQLRPDIIDFHLHVFYEFKSSRWVNSSANNAASARNQLAHYYRLAREIRTDESGVDEPDWVQTHASWKPADVLPMPGDALSIVCTEETDYTAWPEGLILYDVRRFVKDEKSKKIPKRVVLSAFDREFSPVMPDKKTFFKVLRAFQPVHGEFVIIAPIRFHQDWKTYVHQQRLKKAKEFMTLDLPPFLDVRHPVGLFRLSGWTGIGVPVVVIATPMLVIVGAEIAAAAAAASAAMGGAATGAATTGGAAAGGKLLAFPVKAAATKVVGGKAAAVAAGVLVVTAYAESASAAPIRSGGWGAPSGKQVVASSDVKVRPGPPVRIVPIEAFKPYKGVQAASSANNVPGDFTHTPETMGEFKVDTAVLYDWKKHIVIGRLRVEYAQ